MPQYEYKEEFVPYGPHRGRAEMVDGLNKLGLSGWEVVSTKDVIAPQLNVAGTPIMTDGLRLLLKREIAALPTPAETLKRLKDKANA